MRYNKSYLLIFSTVLIPIFLYSKWNGPSVCPLMEEARSEDAEVKQNGDKIFFNIKPEEPPHLYNATTRKVDNDAIKRSITDICTYSDSLPTRLNELTKKQREVLMKHVIVDDEYKFLYCYTPKVACSNWKKIVRLLAGEIDSVDQVKKMDHSGFKKLSDYSPEEINYRMRNYYKYMFVRNPSERVVSAYRNKFNEIEPFYKVYGKKIMDLYHPEKSNLNYEGKVAGDDVAFADFIRYLAGGVELIDMNEHYMPMHLLCQPCLMDYDFIGTTENIEADSETVLRTIKAPDDVHFPKRQSFYKPTSKSLEHFYFSLVPSELLSEYTQRYNLDYQMFLYEKPHFFRGNIVLP